ncbi:MAG: translation initiation factor IF-2 [Gemmatimonadota bacterium]|jgi:translation initiation factor IF-2
MRVFEVAQEFKIEPEKLLQLLHAMGVRARSQASAVPDATIAKLRARFERERRAGHEAEETIETVMEDTLSTAPKRRRRRKADIEPEPEPEPEVEEEAEVEAVVAEGADAPVAEAAEVEPEAAEEEVAAEPEEEAAEPEEEAAEPELVEAPVAEAEPEPAEAAAGDETPQAEEEEPAVEAPAAEAGGEEAAEPVETEAAEAPTPAPREIPAETRPRLRRAAEVLGKIPAARQAPPAPAASAGPGGQVRIQAEGFTPDGRKKKDKRKKKGRVDQGAVQENVARVMSELRTAGKKRRHRREEAPSRVEIEAERKRRAVEEATTVRVNEFLTVSELSELINVNPTAIVASAFKNLGLMVTINQRLDFDQIELLLEEFNFRAVREEEYAADMVEEEVEDSPETLQPRPPIVTVMGHVDHGKTSLLDYIRKTNVIAGESGGITQHIGAYSVGLPSGRSITFLDTPGHAAFTAMRARGAELTDIVILVVAADDSVMPQTIEAISHARNAGVPLIVAINKVDLPGADPARIRQDLLQHEVVVEEFGGQVLSTAVSAKKGSGVEDLLEKVLLQSEMLDLTANPDREAHGIVVEAQLDVGKGPVATVLVTNGTLNVGDSFVCGHYDGRVRALLDERGNTVEQAGPGVPVVVLGIAGVPQAGDALVSMDADRASEIAQRRQRLEREKQLRIKGRGVKLTDISKLLAEGEQAQLNLIIKGDVDGSVQALADALGQLSTSEVEVSVIHRGVGAINEADILLASTSGAIIIGFHVRPGSDARAVAAREGVDIRLYNIIYEAIEDVRAALEGMLQPEEKEVLLGEAEVRQIFRVPRVGTVAGCYVAEGVIERRGRVRLVRDGVQVYEGELGSLKRFKDDVREVREGFECGLSVEGYNDVKVGDRIECYRVETVARTLAGAAGAESS